MSEHIDTIRRTAERFESAHPEIKGRYQIKEDHGVATFFIEGSDNGFDERLALMSLFYILARCILMSSVIQASPMRSS